MSYEERRKEWYAIAAESRETIQCYTCPLAMICRYEKVEVSLELREMEKKYTGIRGALFSPSLSRIEAFKAKLAEMVRLIKKGGCRLLQYG